MRKLLDALEDGIILIAVVTFAIAGMAFGLAWFAATWATLFSAFGQ